jgi:hypothetical protein
MEIHNIIIVITTLFMQVSHEEWVSMWNDYAKNPEKALEWQNRYMNFMFDLEDSSGKIRHGCNFKGSTQTMVYKHHSA